MNKICVECSIFEDEENGISVCKKCGLIYEENMISDEYEKRTFESDNHEIKRVAPPKKPGEQNDLGTIMAIKEKGVTEKIKFRSKFNNKYNKEFI